MPVTDEGSSALADSYQRDVAVESGKIVEMNERHGSFSHGLRNFLGTATFAFAAGKAGDLSFSGATGNVLERSLDALTNLVDQSLGELKKTAENDQGFSLFSLAELSADVKQSADLAANVSGCVFTVSHVDSRIGIRGNRYLLYSSVMNLLQNAFKFTQAHTEVTLDAYADADRILIDVKDHCGGLPGGDAEGLFLPFVQNGRNKSGLGLGLSIARRSIESIGGELSVRDEAGKGCVFTISLPRYAMTLE